jgi:mono/diheme cytochrome c family protein
MTAERNRSGVGRLLVGVVAAACLAPACSDDGDNNNSFTPQQVADGRAIFRDDTFGDEAFWTGTLMMHTVVATITPTMALGVGLKVDSDVVPANVLATADLTSPATTLALLKLNAVVGVKGTVVTNASGADQLMSVGITCALCHSTVDNSVMPGIGKRVDGAPNLDLNPGAIIALSPALTAEQKAVYNSWGAGRYDPRYNIDGMNGPVVIPPAYGLKDSQHTTYTGDGDIKYWNNYVSVTQMGAQGNFKDDRIGVNKMLPSGTADLVTPKLDALRAYQFSLNAPAAAAGSFDSAAAGRGQTVFSANCASCHSGAGRTSGTLVDPAATGMDPTYANRSASKKYRPTPLRGLAQHAPYFHNGSAATLPAVVDHYNTTLTLGLTDAQKTDLVEYLKSI